MPAPDQQQHQPQQQLSQVSRVLFRTDPKTTYGCDLLRPFHAACSEGRAAALRTITHLGLHHCQQQGLPSNRQLALLAAADQATALTLCTQQIAGLLEAYGQQQLQRDVAALEATLNHILTMEGHLRGLPYVAACSSSSTTTSAVADMALPPPAAKPRGPRLTQLTVIGQLTQATVKQLVALLDLLPYTHHLCELFLQTSDNSVLKKYGQDRMERLYGCSWPWEVLRAAAQPLVEAGAVQPSTYTTTTISSSSSNAVGAGTVQPSTHNASSSHSAVGAGAVPDGITWRSSCRIVVADMYELNQLRAPHAQLSVLAPLFEAMQQLQVLGLERVDVGALPKYLAHLHPLRGLHLRRTDVSAPGVLGAIMGLTNLGHLGIVQGQRDCEFNPVTYIPHAFSALVRLTSLDLNGTYITEQGLQGVFTLTGLQQLDLSDTCYFEVLPNSISRLSRLEYLRMDAATVTRLPDCLTALTGLRRLDWGTVTGDIPLHLDVVWRLRSLQHLVIYGERLQLLPAGIAQLTGLTQLSIAAPLKKVPDSLTTLVGLQELLLEDSKPALVLPQGITTLTQLTRVVLPERPLAQQPPAVRGFVAARLAPSPSSPHPHGPM